MTEKYKAIGMFSGGLDSILAAKIMLNEGFEVIALHFYTGFNGKLIHEISKGPNWKWTAAESVVNSAEKLGIKLVEVNISDEYIDIIKHPKYGYGTAVNPCIDCRIFLLRKAREMMEEEQAVLVFSGEVLGQRPMSQQRPTLKLVEKKAGLEGRLLRPLSAKIFEPTIPEIEGIVKREHLYSFSGRTRKPQQKLAEEFGIDLYPQSAGGCILTDKNFGRKYSDLANHLKDPDITLRDFNSIKTGRHLRLESGIKVIAGRNKIENDYLMELLAGEYWLFDTRDFPGAAVFAGGQPSEEDFREIASICARYSKGLKEERIT
ncbi:MAG: hypothetical protein ABIH42_06550, partial [Planctomycetota bacterium]